MSEIEQIHIQLDRLNVEITGNSLVFFRYYLVATLIHL